MNRILLSKANSPAIDGETLGGMFRFRHKIFYQRLGWDVSDDNGYERDCFDEIDPVYMVSRNPGKGIEGCWRLLPTTGPNMLKDTFPQLLRGEAMPNDPAIWELSRFAVSQTHDNRQSHNHQSRANEQGQASLNPVTFSMIRKAYDFAVENDIRAYVTVTSVALERILKSMKLPIYRFGDQKAQRVGKVLSVACWVAINEQFRDVVYPSPVTAPLAQAAA